MVVNKGVFRVTKKSYKNEKSQQVLNELRQHGNVSRAARAVGLNRRTIVRWSETDSVFNAAWVEALRSGRGE